ncbi:MAG: aldo/keto reductase [Verrucomicrobia bacterium]|nr:aldo/keto reductase [Verrucomicrobiota bacterium]
MAKIGTTDLDVFPLALGGNVFGWTADEQQSFAVLDAYAAAGGNFIDTADMYSEWGPGNSGGESETIIGRWMKARGNRDRMIIATKVGKLSRLSGLSAKTIRVGVEQSLERLQTDRIDLYYAHADDPETSLEETLEAFNALVHAGKVRYIAASNYSASRLAEALEVSKRRGFARYVALQPHYNLMERDEYEGALADVVQLEGLSAVPYFALAKGFLTGKYRPGGPEVNSVRAEGARAYLDERGLRVLTALDDIAAAHHTTQAAIALAWLLAQPTVAAPIASARNPAQLAEILSFVDLQLTRDELNRLTTASTRNS